MSAPDLLRAPRVALYGGTFDPVHAGHLFVARTALAGARLDGVVFVPAARSPHKAGVEQAPDADRLAMVRLAIEGDARLDAWAYELERGGVSYTLDTVQRLIELRGADAEPPHLLIGSDQLAGLERWHRVDELVAAVQPLVVRRASRAEVDAAFERLANALAPATFARVHAGLLDADAIHPASATELRAALARGATTHDDWLPAAVRRYATEHGLYARDGVAPDDGSRDGGAQDDGSRDDAARDDRPR